MLATNWVPKIIGLLLAGLLGVCIPIIAMTMQSNLRSERLTWNTLVEYKDIVTRKGSITPDDYTQFRNKLTATNKDWKVKMSVEDTYFYTEDDGKTVKTRNVLAYTFDSSKDTTPIMTDFKEGSIFNITITPIAPSTSEGLLNALTGQDFYAMDYGISGILENTGGMTKYE